MADHTFLHELLGPAFFAQERDQLQAAPAIPEAPMSRPEPVRVNIDEELRKTYRAWQSEGMLETEDGYWEFVADIGRRFGWTREQAYVATDFLFRPENHN